jgi:hypothetical protein
MAPVRIFDNRHRYRPEKIRPDRTGRSEMWAGTGTAGTGSISDSRINLNGKYYINYL